MHLENNEKGRQGDFGNLKLAHERTTRIAYSRFKPEDLLSEESEIDTVNYHKRMFAIFDNCCESLKEFK